MIQVDWTEAARAQLDRVWAVADESELAGLEQVVLGLLADLRSDPLDVGESRDGSYRVAPRPPLTVWFEVFDGGERVRIVRVRRPARRG